jgi:hypothetical protein
MANARKSIRKAFLIAIAAVVLAFLAIAYSGLGVAQQLSTIYLSKVLLGALAAFFLLLFQLRWAFTKHDLSILKYYAKWKLFKHNVAEAAGIVFLASAFFLDYAQFSGWVKGLDVAVFTNLLEVIALVFFSYSYYRLMRLEGA